MAGLVLMGGGVAVLASPGKPAAESAPAEVAKVAIASADVELGVEVTPAGVPGMRVSIDGVVAPGPAPQRDVPRGTDPVLIKVEAPGYVPTELKVVPDRDRTVGVSLTPVARAAAASAKRAPAVASPASPAPPPSGVIRRYPF
jgi:hypothetical protein